MYKITYSCTCGLWILVDFFSWYFCQSHFFHHCLAIFFIFCLSFFCFFSFVLILSHFQFFLFESSFWHLFFPLLSLFLFTSPYLFYSFSQSLSLTLVFPTVSFRISCSILPFFCSYLYIFFTSCFLYSYFLFFFNFICYFVALLCPYFVDYEKPDHLFLFARHQCWFILDRISETIGPIVVKF